MITNCQLTYMYVNDNNTTNDYIHVRTQLFLSTASTSAMAICQKSWTFFLVESPSSIPSLAELDAWETSDWDVCKTVSSTTKKLWPGGGQVTEVCNDSACSNKQYGVFLVTSCLFDCQWIDEYYLTRGVTTSWWYLLSTMRHLHIHNLKKHFSALIGMHCCTWISLGAHEEMESLTTRI